VERRIIAKTGFPQFHDEIIGDVTATAASR